MPPVAAPRVECIDRARLGALNAICWPSGVTGAATGTLAAPIHKDGAGEPGARIAGADEVRRVGDLQHHLATEGIQRLIVERARPRIVRDGQGQVIDHVAPPDVALGRSLTEGGFALYVHWPFCAAKCPYCDFNSHVRARRSTSGAGRGPARRARPWRALTPGRDAGLDLLRRRHAVADGAGDRRRR